MRVFILVIGLLFAAESFGSCNLSSVRIGSSLINTGDSERRVIQAGPDREVQLETSRGGAAGFRFDFYQRGQTVQVYVRGGKVVRICRVRG